MISNAPPPSTAAGEQPGGGMPHREGLLLQIAPHDVEEQHLLAGKAVPHKLQVIAPLPPATGETQSP